MSLGVLGNREGFFWALIAFFLKFLHTSQIQLDLFSLLFCLKGERLTLCNHTGAEPGTDKKKRPLPTLLIRLPVLEQRGCSGAGIIEEIMRYLLFLLPGSFKVFAAVQVNYPTVEENYNNKANKQHWH